MPTLTITVGLPGSGKSTWARGLGAAVISLDQVRDSVGPYDRRSEPFVLDAALMLLRAHLAAGRDAVFDATNLTRRRRSTLRRVARDFGAQYRIAVAEISLEESIERRRGEIPAEGIRRLYSSFEPVRADEGEIVRIPPFELGPRDYGAGRDPSV